MQHYFQELYQQQKIMLQESKDKLPKGALNLLYAYELRFNAAVREYFRDLEYMGDTKTPEGAKKAAQKWLERDRQEIIKYDNLIHGIIGDAMLPKDFNIYKEMENAVEITVQSRMNYESLDE